MYAAMGVLLYSFHTYFFSQNTSYRSFIKFKIDYIEKEYKNDNIDDDVNNGKD